MWPVIEDQDGRRRPSGTVEPLRGGRAPAWV